jgi:hypothetical protein
MSRAEWLAARALLATRRLRRFVPATIATFALVFATVYVVRGPWALRDAERQRAATRAMARGRDTLPLTAGLREAQQDLAVRDSVLRMLQLHGASRAVTPLLSPETQRLRDSLRTVLTQLDGALTRAAKAPLPASYRALANTKAIRSIGVVALLIDTLDLLDRTRLTLDPGAAPQSEFAQLSQRANAIGSTLQALGAARRAAMVRQVAGLEMADTVEGRSASLAAHTIVARTARDSARVTVLRADSLLRDARQWHADLAQRADSAARARAARMLGASPVAAALAALVIVLVLSFTLAVASESRLPRIAHGREVERITGVPVLGTATAAHLPGEGRARLRPALGVDPFRMVYLALTASGTHERTACVTGDDPASVAIVAGRLAVSAASDEHATLAVDLAPGMPSAVLYFGERHEPGFSEAIAAVRLWREVARPVGASEGLGLDIVPPGAPRSDTVEAVHAPSNREEFHLFLAEYDFTVIAAPTPASVGTAALLCNRPATIYVARTGETPLETLVADINALKASTVMLHGVLLIDRIAT